MVTEVADAMIFNLDARMELFAEHVEMTVCSFLCMHL